MPRIAGIPGPYRLFFTSVDCNEPAHVHVERENKTCKFWLEPLNDRTLSWIYRSELNMIRRALEKHRDRILEVWREHCG